MTRQRHYLDHNASAPLLPAARDAVINALDLVGNPSSVHHEGRALRKLIEQARQQVANLAGAARRDVVFTGSASEALTQAIVGGAQAFEVDAIVTSAGEHAAVLAAANASGLPVVKIGLDGAGKIVVAGVAQALEALEQSEETALFAFHVVNNETGVIQPIAEIEALVGPTRHILVLDAVQALGKMELDFGSRGADMMAVSGHKIGGPAGVGALLMKAHCDLVKLVPGGGQEVSRRGGTEAYSLIAGFGAAAAAYPDLYNAQSVRDLIVDVEHGILACAPDAVVFGKGVERIGNVVNFALPGVESAVSMMGLDLEGISISSGSACSSGKVGRSHVLEAMDIAPELASSALRVSLGWNSSQEDCAAFLSALEVVLGRQRKAKGAAA